MGAITWIPELARSTPPPKGPQQLLLARYQEMYPDEGEANRKACVFSCSGNLNALCGYVACAGSITAGAACSTWCDRG